MLRGAIIFSFYLLLIFRRRWFRQGQENLAYSLLAATAATSGIHPSIHPSKSSSHGECSVNCSWAEVATNNGQDLQVHEGVEGGCLEEDGDNIEHQVIKSRRSSSISGNLIWAAAETNNGQDRQVHEGVEGGRLEEDGDIIEHQVIKSWRSSLSSVNHATATGPAGP
jgi:hypothetical protein